MSDVIEFDAKTTISVTRLLELDPEHGPTALLTDNAEPVHLRQGDLDGACGPYAFVMAMIAMGLVSREEAMNTLHSADRRTRFGRFAEILRGFGPLVGAGTSMVDVSLMAETYRTSGLKAEIIEKNSKITSKVADAIDHGGMAIIGVSWSRSEGHWLLAVGHQGRRMDSSMSWQLTHLLCLDPMQNAPKASLWNSVVYLRDPLGDPVRDGKYSAEHWGMDGALSKCRLDEAIILTRPKQVEKFFAD
jgi:hypothetical protein